MKEVRYEFEVLSKSIKILTNGTHSLDDLLSQGKRCDDKKRLGFLKIGIVKNHGKTLFIRAFCNTENQVEST